jgi:hypothetical protein
MGDGDLARRTVKQGFQDHLEAREQGDLEGDLARNYAEDVGMLSAQGRHSSIRDGVNTYLLEDGRIVAQTIHYTVTSRQLKMTHLGDEPDATKG